MFKKITSESNRLGQWSATAICGNDILSSALYVSGIAILFAGVYAPLVFLLIALVLFFYKSVYTEVVEALPLNGGAYNCLINTSSKTIAAVAGVTGVLAYVTTAVISAKTAVEYIHTLLPLPVLVTTLVVLGVFALLVASGLKGSAKVAVVIFLFHIECLVVFLLLGLMFFLQGNSYFLSNITHTYLLIPQQGGILIALFFAFSASLLGVSGFESSANFIEEQRLGVFRKTLRNMLIGVAIFNPLITLVVLNSMDYRHIVHANAFLLSDVARTIGGPIFQYMIVLDAFLVLSGAVLTAYIAVSGLISRMAADACLPNILNTKNRNGSFPFIIAVFFLLCSSILLVTKGHLLALAGVYTISFLGEMTFFAIGNLLLKETRKELKRTYRAPVVFVVLAFLGTMIGIVGNVQIDPANLRNFALYFVPLFLLVVAIIYQDYFVRFLLRVSEKITLPQKKLKKYFAQLTDRRFVAFVHSNENLFRILTYIDRNETGRHITLVHCPCDQHTIRGAGTVEIKELIHHLQKTGAFVHLNIDVLFLDMPFGPRAIHEIVKKLRVKENRILIGSIHDFHPYDYAELGGVRVIF